MHLNFLTVSTCILNFRKVDAIRNGTAMILECRKLKRYDPVALEASAKLLKVVPEVRKRDDEEG